MSLVAVFKKQWKRFTYILHKSSSIDCITENVIYLVKCTHVEKRKKILKSYLGGQFVWKTDVECLI